jgi:hypothetical protein
MSRVPWIETAVVSYPDETGCQHVVARDLGASPAKSKTAGSRGSLKREKPQSEPIYIAHSSRGKRETALPEEKRIRIQ